jgi:hypothetical protein
VALVSLPEQVRASAMFLCGKEIYSKNVGVTYSDILFIRSFVKIGQLFRKGHCGDVMEFFIKNVKYVQKKEKKMKQKRNKKVAEICCAL